MQINVKHCICLTFGLINSPSKGTIVLPSGPMEKNVFMRVYLLARNMSYLKIVIWEWCISHTSNMNDLTITFIIILQNKSQDVTQHLNCTYIYFIVIALYLTILQSDCIIGYYKTILLFPRGGKSTQMLSYVQVQILHCKHTFTKSCMQNLTWEKNTKVLASKYTWSTKRADWPIK